MKQQYINEIVSILNNCDTDTIRAVLRTLRSIQGEDLRRKTIEQLYRLDNKQMRFIYKIAIRL